MAGHSHWANIVHKKGAADAKRGKLFSKLSRAIIVAAKNGGGDPGMNLKLRYAIDKARQASMPKDNIERAIKKGVGDLDGVNFDEILYEGYGPGGVAVMADICTDNRNRTSGEIRKIFDKAGGNLGTAGCVSYMFERKGFFTVAQDKTDEDSLMTATLDAGAEDIRATDDGFEVYCDPGQFSEVQAALEENSIPFTVAEITQIPQSQIDVDVDVGQKILRLMDALDEHDDVQNVYANINITDDIVAAMHKEG